MFDKVENYYICEHTLICCRCEYASICKLFVHHKYFGLEETDELFTIHYAEGEI